jgi:2',3'-cyclic-nucleotide 2'-phosphodiesterase (5'-nucleotidase family)
MSSGDQQTCPIGSCWRHMKPKDCGLRDLSRGSAVVPSGPPRVESSWLAPRPLSSSRDPRQLGRPTKTLTILHTNDIHSAFYRASLGLQPTHVNDDKARGDLRAPGEADRVAERG